MRRFVLILLILLTASDCFAGSLLAMGRRGPYNSYDVTDFESGAVANTQGTAWVQSGSVTATVSTTSPFSGNYALYASSNVYSQSIRITRTINCRAGTASLWVYNGGGPVASGGMAVTINGSNVSFTLKANGVTVADIPAGVWTQATFSVPAGSNTIQLYNGAGNGSAPIGFDDIVIPTPSPTAAVMASPASGATLSGASQTFSWNNASADQYVVWIGSTPGGNDIVAYPAGGTTGTSIALSGLPTDGSTLYVRLWSYFGATALYRDYTYTAYNATAQHSDVFSGNGVALASHDGNWVDMDSSHVRSNVTLYNDTARLTDIWALGGAVYTASSSGVSQISVQPVTGEVLKGPCVRAGGANGTGYCVNLSLVASGNWTRFILTRNSSFLTYSNPQAITVPTASAHTLRVEATGAGPVVIKAYIDNTPYITYTDSSGYLLGEHPGFIIEGNGNLANTAVDNWSDYAN